MTDNANMTDEGKMTDEAKTRTERLEDALARMIRLQDSMLNSIDPGSAFFNAETIREMNEAPGDAEALLEQSDRTFDTGG